MRHAHRRRKEPLLPVTKSIETRHHDCRFTSNGGSGTFKFNQDVTQRPGSSVTPSANGDLSVEATSNTTLTFKFKGDDGVVRSGTITLS